MLRAGTLAAIGTFLLTCAAGYVFTLSRPMAERAELPLKMALSVPIIYAFLYAALTLGSPRVVARWRERVDTNPALIWTYPCLVVVLYLAFGVPTMQVRLWEFATLLGYAFVPVALAALRRLWADWLIAICLWWPVQVKALSLPQMPLENGGLPTEVLVAVTIAFWTLLVVRRLEGFHLPLTVSRADLLYGLRLFTVFASVMLPLGLLTGFLEWRPFTLHHTYGLSNGVEPFLPLLYALLPVGLYFTVAVPEEALFRGIVQNLLARTLRAPIVALVSSAVLFGIVHSRGQHEPFYLAMYMAFAGLAGAFYGWAYCKTGRLAAGAVMHALVDWTWLILFNPNWQG